MRKGKKTTGTLRSMLCAALCAVVLAASTLLSGCAQAPMSAAHLKRDPWSLEEPRSLVTKFMRFDYQVMPVGDVAGIKGWAYLDTAKLPEGVKWVESLTFTAYLCDPDGRVMAQDTRTFLPREARADDGIGFEFTLQPEAWGQRPLFIAFGYRLVLTEGRGVQGAKGPFFASEDAATR
ncbi:MAG TPA: hypothetical protein VN419_08490 [Humidesulfovibrio sp.]|uniref:hypothetical protein n=1 Tax=Humidesulfovibrio sp. TaxID=2910988 RepID=UPI002CBFA05B|nr:hypothetical protein [Humidesulfovibrio sp.]HWR04047.1 hypothetical protein [Humidesulfovibrio sp.]